MADKTLTAEERAGRAFPVSWDQFHRDCRALTWRLNDAGPFAAIIAITRGGLVPAAIVARELGIRVIDTVGIASYDHTRQGELNILKAISEDTLKLGSGTGKGKASAAASVRENGVLLFAALTMEWTGGMKVT